MDYLKSDNLWNEQFNIVIENRRYCGLFYKFRGFENSSQNFYTEHLTTKNKRLNILVQ